MTSTRGNSFRVLMKIQAKLDLRKAHLEFSRTWGYLMRTSYYDLFSIPLSM